ARCRDRPAVRRAPAPVRCRLSPYLPTLPDTDLERLTRGRNGAHGPCAAVRRSPTQACLGDGPDVGDDCPRSDPELEVAEPRAVTNHAVRSEGEPIIAVANVDRGRHTALPAAVDPGVHTRRELTAAVDGDDLGAGRRRDLDVDRRVAVHDARRARFDPRKSGAQAVTLKHEFLDPLLELFGRDLANLRHGHNGRIWHRATAEPHASE